MSDKSFKVKKSLQIMPESAPLLNEAGDLGVDSSDGNRLQFNNGTVTQRVLLQEDALAGGFTLAENVTYDNAASGLAATDAQEALDELALENDTQDTAITAAQDDATQALADSATAQAAADAAQEAADDAQSAADAAQTDATQALAEVATAQGEVDALETRVTTAEGEIDALQAASSTYQPLDADLTALAALSTTGVVARTAANTYATRTLTGTADQISVTAGDGVSDNPTVAIAADPVLPGTGAVRVPGGTTIQRPASPADGMIRRNTDTNQLEGYFSGTWGPIAGSGGGINWIIPSDGSATTGYTVYNDGASAVPVDAQGGTATVTFTTTSTAPLHGLSSYLFTKPASNVQGQGWAKDFAVDVGYKTTPQTISMLLSVDSGTYADGDMTFWIIEQTNGERIQPSAYRLLNSLGTQQIKMEFQPLGTGSGVYRLVGHVTSTSALAYTLKIDDISVSPNTYSTGASGTDAVVYPMTIGAATTAPTKGTVSIDRATWARDKDHAVITYTYAQTGAGSAGSGRYLFPLPAGLQMDPSKTSFSTGAIGADGSAVGYGKVSNTTSAATNSATQLTVVPYNATNLALVIGVGVAGQLGNINSGDYHLGTTNLFYSFTARVPILGWGTSQVLSSDTDTRVVAFAASTTTNPSALAILNMATVQEDTHAGFNPATNLYTVQVPGNYDIDAMMAGGNGGNFNGTVAIYIDGVSVKSSSAGTGTATQAIQVSTAYYKYLKAGQTISFYGGASSGTWSVASSAFRIRRTSGPAQIAASEKVFLEYNSSPSTSLTADVTNMPYNVKVTDSHGAWNGTQFTAPRPGWYNLDGELIFNTSIAGEVSLYVNGTLRRYLTGDGSIDRKHYNTGVYLNAGDTASIRHTVSGTLLVPQPLRNYITITSQG